MAILQADPNWQEYAQRLITEYPSGAPQVWQDPEGFKRWAEIASKSRSPEWLAQDAERVAREVRETDASYANAGPIGSIAPLALGAAGMMFGLPPVWAGAFGGATSGLSSSPSAGFGEMLTGAAKGGALGYAGGQISQGVGDIVGYNPAIADATWSSTATPISQWGAQAGQSALTGAARGGASALIGGRDIGQGMISGGLGAGTNLAGNYLDQAASGANNMADYDDFFSQDAIQLAQQGVPTEQIVGMLSQAYGFDNFVASDIASLAEQGLSASQITDMISSSYNESGSSGTGILDYLKGGYQSLKEATGLTGGQMLSGASKLLGGYLQGEAATGAARTSADAQLRAAQLAADAAKFRPIGVTTRFGKSQFGYDPSGNLVSAGYGLAPDILAQQNQMMGATGGLLNQFTGAQQATAPMGQSAQSMMTLGQGYLGTSPQEQAAKYMAEQQALLAGPRAAEYSRMQQQLQNQGRAGLSMGGGGGMTAANPEMQAYYNALNQQNLALAAQATQGGMDYSKFGAGMVGTGGDMLRDMYGTQQAAYAPYQTMLGGATGLEQLGQQAMGLGTELGSTTTAAAAAGGRAMQQGMLGSAQTMQDVNKVSPWGTLLKDAGQTFNQYTQPAQQNQYRFNPMTGQPIDWSK